MSAKNGDVGNRSRCCDVDPSIPTVITAHCANLPSRKIKHIPPPLDLNKQVPLDETNSDTYGDFAVFSASPPSPISSKQKHLPFRKRAFSWTTFQDESNCSSISPGPSSASVIQRSTYSSFLPNSPHINRLSVIKQESVDQSDVFMDYLIPNMKIKEESTFTNYTPPQNPAFLTPATPSPISPSNFPPSSTFFPSNFQQKVSPFPWQSSSSLLSPAPSLLGSSQEELAMCKPWKYDESDVEDATSKEEQREDYLKNEPQPGTSELCERLERFDFVMPTVRSTDKRFGEETCPTPAKRPMNGFMLFAQKYRLQLIQQFPGRDNRAISVMLGDAWKRLNPVEKEIYTAEAHVRAEEYRRLFPDCWKRKRSKSTS